MMSQKRDDQTSKDTKDKESHPWDQSFADDRDDQGNLSRTRIRRQNHGNTMVTVILVAIIIVIAVASLVYGLARQSAVNKPENQSTEQVADGSSSSSSKHAKSSTSSHKKSSSKKTASSKTASSKKSTTSTTTASSAKTTSSYSATSSATTKPNKTSSSATTTSSSTSTTTGSKKYATVESGQGVYRVATNAGISVQELLQLNGLSSASSLHPGQKLRVK